MLLGGGEIDGQVKPVRELLGKGYTACLKPEEGESAGSAARTNHLTVGEDVEVSRILT